MQGDGCEHKATSSPGPLSRASPSLIPIAEHTLGRAQHPREGQHGGSRQQAQERCSLPRCLTLHFFLLFLKALR